MSKTVYRLAANSTLHTSRTLPLQGSKSYTNRALMMAALSGQHVGLQNASPSDDSVALSNALTRFGVACDWTTPSSIAVSSPATGFVPYTGTLDIGPAGTTMRFLAAFCSFIPGCAVHLRGSERMHERPIEVLVTALSSLGARITYTGRAGCPPLYIEGVLPEGRVVELDGSVSSQYFSACLLLAPLFRNGLTVRVAGEQVSRSYIDMTLSAMQSAGIDIQNQNYETYIIPPDSRYSFREYLVEGDASGASYFWGLAALSDGTIRVENISADSAQGDAAFPVLLERMGCTVEHGPNSIAVTGPRGPLRAINADMELMPDTAQTLAVLAACAEGTTTLTGLQTLRIKETDRITALQQELKKCGIHTESTDDTLSIHGGTIQPARIDTYDDHRMAMSFAMLGAHVTGMEISDPLVVTKSFPTFWQALSQMGVDSLCL